MYKFCCHLKSTFHIPVTQSVKRPLALTQLRHLVDHVLAPILHLLLQVVALIVLEVTCYEKVILFECTRELPFICWRRGISFHSILSGLGELLIRRAFFSEEYPRTLNWIPFIAISFSYSLEWAFLKLPTRSTSLNSRNSFLY